MWLTLSIARPAMGESTPIQPPNTLPRSPDPVRRFSIPFARNLSDLFKAQPLALGAIGIAIGAGIAAALPGTEIEADYLGETSDTVKTKAAQFAAEQTDRVTTVAGNVVMPLKKKQPRRASLLKAQKPPLEISRQNRPGCRCDRKKYLRSGKSGKALGALQSVSNGRSSKPKAERPIAVDHYNSDQNGE